VGARALRGPAPDDAHAVAARLGDPALKPGTIKDSSEHADDVRIEHLPDCGHFPPDECPNLVAEHLRGFFRA